MKLNEMNCPTCGFRCWTSDAYVRCDSCGTVYYASQSLTAGFAPLMTRTVCNPHITSTSAALRCFGREA